MSALWLLGVLLLLTTSPCCRASAGAPPAVPPVDSGPSPAERLLPATEHRPQTTTLVGSRASGAWVPKTPDHAFDGDENGWNSMTCAPAWIEADLGYLAAIDSIEMQIFMIPAGHTTHQVWVSDQPIGDDRSDAHLVWTIEGDHVNESIMRAVFDRPALGRYVQVFTTEDPSWVALRGIHISHRPPVVMTLPQVLPALAAAAATGAASLPALPVMAAASCAPLRIGETPGE